MSNMIVFVNRKIKKGFLFVIWLCQYDMSNFVELKPDHKYIIFLIGCHTIREIIEHQEKPESLVSFVCNTTLWILQLGRIKSLKQICFNFFIHKVNADLIRLRETPACQAPPPPQQLSLQSHPLFLPIWL